MSTIRLSMPYSAFLPVCWARLGSYLHCTSWVWSGGSRYQSELGPFFADGRTGQGVSACSAWTNGRGHQASAPPLYPRDFTTAVTPTAIEFAGTSHSTTEFAPIMTLSPIWIAPSSFAPAPISTL